MKVKFLITSIEETLVNQEDVDVAYTDLVLRAVKSEEHDEPEEATLYLSLEGNSPYKLGQYVTLEIQPL